MPQGKIVDILFTCKNGAVPVEAKGQWNKDLWTAPSSQLDALYLRDSRTQDLGIYLVYWFGKNVGINARLKPPPKGIPKPTSPGELKKALIASLPPERRGRVLVEVLDFSRSSG
jgi:hypothetical protein